MLNSVSQSSAEFWSQFSQYNSLSLSLAGALSSAPTFLCYLSDNEFSILGVCCSEQIKYAFPKEFLSATWMLLFILLLKTVEGGKSSSHSHCQAVSSACDPASLGTGLVFLLLTISFILGDDFFIPVGVFWNKWQCFLQPLADHIHIQKHSDSMADVYGGNVLTLPIKWSAAWSATK